MNIFSYKAYKDYEMLAHDHYVQKAIMNVRKSIKVVYNNRYLFVCAFTLIG